MEFSFDPSDGERVRFLFEDILGCKEVSSYERIRELIFVGSAEVALDEFPFGFVVELELLSGSEGDEEAITALAKELGLDLKRSSPLSCDDLYRLLCEQHDIVPKAHIRFSDGDMPRIKSQP